MKTKNAIRRMHVAQTTKYMWAAAATLMVILILGAVVGTPFAAAGAAPGQAELASTARWKALGEFYAARLEASAAASSARWKAAGEYYTAENEASLAASSARYEAMAKFFGGSGGDPLAENPELSFARNFSPAAGGGDLSAGFLAENPELSFARGSYYNAAGFLAANPEVMSARSFSPATISGDLGAGGLAENPELNAARRAYDRGYLACTLTGDELAMNPELALFQQSRDC